MAFRQRMFTTKHLALIVICITTSLSWSAVKRSGFSEVKNPFPVDTTSDSYRLQTNSQGISIPYQHVAAVRYNCTPAAIEQFPKPLFTPEARLKGALVLYVLTALYMFLGLAIICDEYFVPSLEIICEALHLQPDVAGATFMAAGSSAPELATSLIAVFVTKDDIGVGTVVGSAVFNILLLIAICCLCTAAVVQLDWFPITRDSVIYLVSVCALIYTIEDEIVTWYESVALLLLYVLYCIVMHFNSTLEKWAKKVCKCQAGDNEISPLIGYNKVDELIQTCDNESQPNSNKDIPAEVSEESISSALPQDNDDMPSKFICPKGIFKGALWAVSMPWTLACYVTIPDCRKRRWRRWHLLTFLMSVIWLCLQSYLLVWMITVIGFTLWIPDTVMSLTFLAAGVSLPDVITSVIVMKEGLGDMAISNAIGSNVFDILLCLGLPWFIQTVINKPGSVVLVYSKGLVYSAISLLSTVAILLVAMHCNKWKLNKLLGVVLLVLYVIFMVFAVMYELNVFGDFCPPSCSSDY